MLVIQSRASKSNPCPICGGDHSCSRTTDNLHFCWREHSNQSGYRYLGDTQNGFGMFRRDGDDVPPPRPAAKPTCHKPGQHSLGSPTDRLGKRPNWTGLLLFLVTLSYQDQKIAELAQQLGVTFDALRDLGCLYMPRAFWSRYRNEFNIPVSEHFEGCWIFPEYDGERNIVGFSTRDEDGTKRCLPGSKRGIGIPESFGWAAGPDVPVILVEGASDAATLGGAGIDAMSRPNNIGGGRILPTILETINRERPIIVLGENDEKPNGLAPGRDGARKIAGQLADALPGRTIYWVLPPDGAKDARAWFAGRSGPEVGGEFLALLLAGDLHQAEVKHAYTMIPSEQASTPQEEPGQGTCSTSSAEEKKRLSPPSAAGTIAEHLPPGATATPLPHTCPRRVSEVLNHRDDPTRYRVANLPCDCWNCEACRHRLAGEQVEHLSGCIQDSMDEGMEVRGQTIQPEDRKAARSALERAGAKSDAGVDYVELQQHDGTYLLIFALSAGLTLPSKLAGSKPLSAKEIAHELAAWGDGMREHGPPAPKAENGRMRVVNASARWRRGKPARSNWRILGAKEAQKLETVQQVLQQQGVTFVVWESDWPENVPLDSRPPYVWGLEFRVTGDPTNVLLAVFTAEDPLPAGYSAFDDLPG